MTASSMGVLPTNTWMPRLRSAEGPVMVAPRSLYVSPMLTVAGLSPLTFITGGVEDAFEVASFATDTAFDDCGVLSFGAFAAETIAWNCAGVTHVEPTQS